MQTNKIKGSMHNYNERVTHWVKVPGVVGGGGGGYGKFPNELRRSLWIKEALNSLHNYSSQAC